MHFQHLYSLLLLNFILMKTYHIVIKKSIQKEINQKELDRVVLSLQGEGEAI